MAKRRDNKGRILREGESQREDGRYMFRYTDISGERRTLYSYRLTETDKTPDGRRNCKPLRLMEQEVRRDVWDGINVAAASRLTLNDLFEEYMNNRRDLRETTNVLYRNRWRRYVTGTIGEICIAAIKYTTVKRLYSDLMERGISAGTINNLHSLIHPVLQCAVRDGLLRTNPSNDLVREVTKGCKQPEKRHSMSIEEQMAFLQFTKEHYSHYYPLFVVLLGTGLRFGEAAGLTWDDVDFDNRLIHVGHSLAYIKNGKSGCVYRINDPKTLSGKRDIPILDEVFDALMSEKIRQERHGGCISRIDGYSDFVFTSMANTVIRNENVIRLLQKIGDSLNIHPLTPHILRHTFCTRLCENEPNIKVIQEIMGHNNIHITMDIYAEATKEQKKKSFANLEGKLGLTSSFTPILHQSDDNL